MLNETTIQKITANGWIIPEDIGNAYAMLIRDVENIVKTGFRGDLLIDRLDNFKMELITRCNRNMERELNREKLFGDRRKSNQPAREQRNENQVSDDLERSQRTGLGSGYNGES